MLRNEVKKKIDHELQYEGQHELYHYNCAQAILCGANDYYNLNLDTNAMKLIAPFGGGMYTGNTCGMLTGGVAVIGVLFAEDMPTQNLKMKEITRYWVKQFECEFQNINCNLIKDINVKNNQGCTNLILRAADLLERIIERYKHDITIKRTDQNAN